MSDTRILMLVRRYLEARVMVAGQRPGQRVMVGVRRFLARWLRLQLNEKKSAVDPAWRRPYLGFAFHFGGRIKVRLDGESLGASKQSCVGTPDETGASPWRNASPSSIAT